MKPTKLKRGFTLIELIITISLLSMIILLSTSMISLTMTAQKKTMDEYEINTTIRQASQRANEIIRYSKAVFAVPVDFVSDPSKMDPGWSYFAISPDKRRIVQYVYDDTAGTHLEQILVDASPNVEYEIEFVKDATTSSDNLLKFQIVGYVTKTESDGTLVRTGQKIAFESEVEAQNALQIVDKGTVLSPSVALAFRNDSSAQGTGRTQVATITIVLDVSGSMDTSLNGLSRIARVKNALLGYTKDNGTIVEGIINTFSRENNIEISIVPFSQTANYPTPNSASNLEHPFYNAEDDKSTLVTLVNNIETYGNTNTGDGLRRAYYRLIDFSPVAEGYNTETEQYNYMILLVDGETNQSSWESKGYQQLHSFFGFTWYTDEYTYYSQYTGRGGITPSISYDNVTRVYPYSRNNSSYISTIGSMIVAAETKSYVIGFSNGITTEISNLGTALDAEQIYNYNDDFDLDEVFDNIAQDILAELWLVTGPQIMN
ncbi:VWA domain-containing protein [Fusibacter bizertensis]|uniref:VWA domain-containing protein n=1 Tax=Fusibacter bizertensis TaxID=1488331 RepID=A0ABT6NG74_9FIRM|nr:VWA domain-containing protein [Fusibacter bizertensis]MDH8679419.1 VWA domain-containing protein [Fusibacter bizertensis]